ncbi:hypothetical protein J6590_074684 [Homalodisca vitripennis]|nr:hypothetical protein J6590_074684 [Homalodisca vitripennis]
MSQLTDKNSRKKVQSVTLTTVRSYFWVLFNIEIHSCTNEVSSPMIITEFYWEIMIPNLSHPLLHAHGSASVVTGVRMRALGSTFSK